MGVSLVAIAAVVASLTIVRQQRQELERKSDDGQKHEPISPAAVDLDQLRAAGL